ncbi:PIN domain-containing protein [Sphingomonas baiyangensis]|uniref:Nucleotide-binding protein n=1 Tax=Sphingomonas baiyangensis TaxID=2572576 RepID=A0A4U1L8Y0_9SPHN|nr:PIN domain-containing protein [Sphingomonas baiyangensis]TKD52983.1 nucleotide-binding protein [Sphingomonas baiyangensis]
MPTFVVDANVMVSAMLGRSLPLLLDIALESVLLTPMPMIFEAKHAIAQRRGADAAARVDGLLELIAPVQPFAFVHCEAEARARLEAGGQSDWPVLATALAFDAEIWSRDVDFFGIGVAVWTTRNISRAIPVRTNRNHGATDG